MYQLLYLTLTAPDFLPASLQSTQIQEGSLHANTRTKVGAGCGAGEEKSPVQSLAGQSLLAVEQTSFHRSLFCKMS